MRIFLIGMPGSGKTHWMKHLAEALHYKSIDIDQHIEQQNGLSIPELFTIGESFFRNKEREALLHIIAQEKEHIVIATGGGLPCYLDNVNIMKEAGFVVYLDTALETIIENLVRSPGNRPLLHNTSAAELKQKLQEIYKSRKEIYEQAHLKTDPNTISISTFAHQVLQNSNKTQPDDV